MLAFSENLSKLFFGYLTTLDKEAIKHSQVVYIGSETVGEVIEKLIILNIRIWMLEDDAALAKSQGCIEEYAGLKKKLDYCFKIIRPRLVAALDGLLYGVNSDAVSFKHYKHESNVIE